MEEEKLEIEVLTSEKDAQAIREAISEAEKELNKSSQAEVGKMMFLPPGVVEGAAKGLRKFVVEVAVDFAKYFAQKYGESLADWLARKLGLQESKGEGASESG